MPFPNLGVDWRTYQSESARLQGLIPSLAPLSPAHRKLIADIAMVRLFLLFENTIASAAAKLLCGANYLDGTAPIRLVAPRSLNAALAAMQTHGRARQRQTLPWTGSREIRENVVNTLDGIDPFFATVTRHGALLTEMRYVRNHIAHSNARTRVRFQQVVRQYYGGLKRGVTPGVLLLTGAFGQTCILERYIIASRVAIQDVLRA